MFVPKFEIVQTPIESIMMRLNPDQSQTLAKVFHQTKTFNDLWNKDIDLAKRVTSDIQDIELKGNAWKDLPEDTKKYLDKALIELGRDIHTLFPDI